MNKTAKEVLQQNGYHPDTIITGNETVRLMTDYANHVTEEKDKEIQALRAALKLCEPYIHDAQHDNTEEPSAGIRYDFNLEKAYSEIKRLTT